MSREEQVQAWQARIDEDFPDGLLILSGIPDTPPDEDGPQPTIETFRVRRVEVKRMASPFSPVIYYAMSMGMTAKDRERTIDTYYVEQSEPCKMVRVTFTDGETVRFSGCLSDKAKRDLARKEW